MAKKTERCKVTEAEIREYASLAFGVFVQALNDKIEMSSFGNRDVKMGLTEEGVLEVVKELGIYLIIIDAIQTVWHDDLTRVFERRHPNGKKQGK